MTFSIDMKIIFLACSLLFTLPGMGQTQGGEASSSNGANTYSGAQSAPQFIPTGSAPTIANGAAAGTSPGTPTITGSNTSGVITVITGTATTSGTLATITFNGTLGTAPQGCQLTPRAAAGATVAAAAPAATAIYTSPPTTTGFTIGAVSGIAVSTTFTWSYLCM